MVNALLQIETAMDRKRLVALDQYLPDVGRVNLGGLARSRAGRELAGFDAGLRDELAEGAGPVVAHRDGRLRFGGECMPAIRLVLVHRKMESYLPNEKSARSRERFGL